jgi:hypothetical protein
MATKKSRKRPQNQQNNSDQEDVFLLYSVGGMGVRMGRGGVFLYGTYPPDTQG